MVASRRSRFHTIPACPPLSGCLGLDRVREVPSLILSGNAALADLGALTNATFEDASLTVTDNQALPNLVGLEGMVGASAIILAGNAGLRTLQGLENLRALHDLAALVGDL